MIINVVIERYGLDCQLLSSEKRDVDVNSSWYTAQTYFNEHLKAELLDEDNDTYMMLLKWNGKNSYWRNDHMKRKKNDDQRHEEGRA